MKKLFFLLILVASVISCNKKEPQYVITGNLDGLVDGGKIYLKQRKAGEYLTVDSAIVSNGSFMMVGKTGLPEMYYLYVDGKRGAGRFFLENSEIQITGSADTLYKIEVSGSSVQDEYKAFNDELSMFNDEFRANYEQRKLAKDAKDDEKLALLDAQSDSIYKKYIAFQLDYVKGHPASYISPTVLRGAAYDLDGNEIGEYLDAFDDSLNELAEVKALKERVEVLKKVAIGQPAPDFTQNDPDGNPVKLSSLFGSYLLVDFWAAWCGPCRAENPNIVKAYQKYHDKGFEVLGVSLDRDKDKWLEAVEKDGLLWAQVSDLQYWQNAAAKLYGINSIPGNVLLDKEGTIIARNVRGEELHEKLAELLD